MLLDVDAWQAGWRLGGRMFFGLGHARVWVLLAVLVLILVITLLNRRNH